MTNEIKMQTIPIDLSVLTADERRQFAENPQVLSASCDAVCCLYMRYSSDRQSEQSIEGQLRELIAYCRKHDYRIAAVYVDRAISAHASMEKRPDFQRMLTDSARAPWKTVLVYKLEDLPGIEKTALLHVCGSGKTAVPWNPRRRV